MFLCVILCLEKQKEKAVSQIILNASAEVKRKLKRNEGFSMSIELCTKYIDELAREERLAYFKKWRANNKDKVREHNKKYWLKRAIAKKQESEGKNE